MQFKSILLSLLIVLLLGGTALAQDGFELKWGLVYGGGGQSAAGDYTMVGVIGQPEAGPPMSGGDYTLHGGIASGSAPSGGESTSIYLPLVIK